MVLLIVGVVVLAIVVLCIAKGRKDLHADWTPGNFCIKCGTRHPQDFGLLGHCSRCGEMDYEVRKGPPQR